MSTDKLDNTGTVELCCASQVWKVAVWVLVESFMDFAGLLMNAAAVSGLSAVTY